MNIQNPPATGYFCGPAVSRFPNGIAPAKMAGLRASALFVALAILLIISTAPANAQNQNVAPAQNANQNPSGSAAAGAPPNAGAAAGTPSNGSPGRNEQKEIKSNTLLDSRVTEVYNLGNGNREAGLDEIIIVRVEKLEALINKAKCLNTSDASCKKQEIALFIDGRIIRGLEPESGAPMLEEPQAATTPGNKPDGNIVRDGTLRYHLRRDPLPPNDSPENQKDNEEHWADLLGLSIDTGGWSLRRKVEISVGLANEDPIDTDVRRDAEDNQAFYLIRMRKYRLLFWVIFTLVCIYILIRLARESDILRDRAPVIWGKRKPYSLSAFQAAWWFVLIIISFIFIWLVTGQYNLSSTALILLGIGLGTGLTATVIDSNKRDTSADTQVSSDELNTLLLQKQELETELNEQAKKKNQDEFNKTKGLYNAKIAEIQQKFPNAIGPPHEKFYLDILSDAGGISFHRFQMLIWTIVLGIFFIYSVLGRLAMPQFSQTLLLLMGISSGTYLGFKIPENNNLAAFDAKLGDVSVASTSAVPPKPGAPDAKPGGAAGGNNEPEGDENA